MFLSESERLTLLSWCSKCTSLLFNPSHLHTEGAQSSINHSLWTIGPLISNSKTDWIDMNHSGLWNFNAVGQPPSLFGITTGPAVASVVAAICILTARQEGEGLAPGDAAAAGGGDGCGCTTIVAATRGAAGDGDVAAILPIGFSSCCCRIFYELIM